MKPRNIFVWGILLICIIFLTACASSVKRIGDFSNYEYTGQKFNKINVSLSPEAQEKYRGYLFNADKLSWAVQSQIRAKGLFSDLSQNLIEVVITHVRIRSSFIATQVGIMAGADRLEGDVFVKNEEGKILNSFSITASYALGGSIGGNDDIRMNWLYDKFAKLTVKNILGKRGEGTYAPQESTEAEGEQRGVSPEKPSQEQTQQKEEPRDSGIISITSDPPGAKVFIDGEYKGQTPTEISLTSGTYQLFLQRLLYEPYKDSVVIERDQTKTLNIKLSPEGEEQK
ncbi:MAG: PEGA domain-containing protein [Deltaproteobacteria bacterium]|nr:PEGA domain-containing protein [Deltaproteobacteria bacterium]